MGEGAVVEIKVVEMYCAHFQLWWDKFCANFVSKLDFKG